MSFIATGWAVKAKCQQVSDKALLLILAFRVNDEESRETGFYDAFPSIPMLIQDSGISRSIVYESLNRLYTDGLVTKLPKQGGRDHNTYRLNVTPPENEQAPKNANAPRRQSAGHSRASHGQTVSQDQPPFTSPEACGIRGWDFGDPAPQRHVAA